ncbi:HupE/UreJ family protein [Mesorhizobium sp.]|uniref:HupE/UreJ family protein n=1 Tax=Mesorhizobium sp. TaxID=1871066 RepID=UPI0025795699|nr:HupE/UreJ family protein [Mesorhizobium sp.]
MKITKTAASTARSSGSVVLGRDGHGTEITENAGGLEYLTGFVLATALLHGASIGLGRASAFCDWQAAAAAAAGLGLIFGALWRSTCTPLSR